MDIDAWLRGAFREGPPLDPAQLNRARRMWREDHFNTAEIADRLGVGEGAVYNSLRWIKGD